jgi:hypothetical protein
VMAELLGAPPPRFEPGNRESLNRRISNRRLRNELRVDLSYPDYQAGLRQAAGTLPS